jgi:hypothetical protein
MNKNILSPKKESEAAPQKGLGRKPRWVPRMTLKVVGRADEKTIRLALEPLLAEFIRQERAEKEKEHAGKKG